jgi:hypothetical protein
VTIRPGIYHRPKSPSGSATSLRQVPGPNALRIMFSSSPASPGRPRTHRKVSDLPPSQVRNSGETFLPSRPWLPHIIRISVINSFSRYLIFLFISLSINEKTHCINFIDHFVTCLNWQIVHNAVLESILICVKGTTFYSRLHRISWE